VNGHGRPSGADLRLLAEVGVASAVGGLMAVSALWWDARLITPVVILGLAVTVVVFCVMVVKTLRPDPPAQPPPPLREQPSGAHAAYAQPPISGRQYPRPPAAVPPVEATRSWYDDAARDAAAQRSAAASVVGTAAQVPPEPEGNGAVPRIEEYRVPGGTSAVRRVVQCPQCAGFDLDVRREPDGLAFECRSCRQDWRWAPGTPWPPTIARPVAGRTPRTGSV
jgi:hypothetical protein